MVGALLYFAFSFGLLGGQKSIPAIPILPVAQNTPPTVKVIAPKAVKVGVKTVVTLELAFEPGLHGYANPPSEDYQIPVKVSLGPKVSKTVKIVKIGYPKGTLASMAGEAKPSRVYEGVVKIPVTILVAKSGKYELPVVVSYQQCNDENCFPPAKVQGMTHLVVVK